MAWVQVVSNQASAIMPSRPRKKMPTSTQKKLGAKTPSKFPKIAAKAVKPVEAEIVEEAQVTPSAAVDTLKVKESKPYETTIPTESSSQAEKNDSAAGKKLIEDVKDEKVVKAEKKEAEVIKEKEGCGQAIKDVKDEGLGVEQTDVVTKEMQGDRGVKKAPICSWIKVNKNGTNFSCSG